MVYSTRAVEGLRHDLWGRRGSVGKSNDMDGRAWRVGLVDDHPLFGRALQELLRPADDLQWVGCHPSVQGLLDGCPDVDVVVLDLRLTDGTTPYENVERLKQRGVQTLIYTSGEHPELVRSAARAGVLGVVLKSESEPTVIEAIRCVARGEPVITTEWAAAVDGDPQLGGVDLTPQLARVLTLYASGETAASVADTLGISVDTVPDYLKRIRLKYAEAGRPTRSKLDFYKRAVEDGFLPFPRRRNA